MEKLIVQADGVEIGTIEVDRRILAELERLVLNDLDIAKSLEGKSLKAIHIIANIETL